MYSGSKSLDGGQHGGANGVAHVCWDFSNLNFKFCQICPLKSSIRESCKIHKKR